ncbi:YheC/YheD family protein [Gracilibacillus suaedae]|uniref:YheC/YheD family protein n=1 Tax=Gracilibacillus suaedae TaxID=2820273 RepID=UPI001ABE4E9D|nr:YheC/YheD family protein [Gracilibacillus suaedae]
MRQTFQIIAYPNDKNRMIVPIEIYYRLKQISMLQHGLQNIPCDILSHHNKSDTIYLSSSIMKQFHLINHAPIILDIDTHTCHMNYLFGVFSHRSPQQTSYERLYQEMASVGHTHGFKTIFFSYHHIHSQTNSLTGVVWQEQKWKTIETDIPPVIYNRIPNRKIESHKKVQKIKQHLTTNSIIFNPDFFNKWQVYDDIINHERINYLLPDTTFHPSTQTIRHKLSQHPITLMSLKDDDTNHFYLEEVGGLLFVTHNYNSRQYYQDLEQFKQAFFPNGFQQYVLQDALDLMQHQGDPFYLRVHTNKTKQWQVSFLYGRKNIGNEIVNLDTLNLGRNIVKKVKELAIVLSKLLENMLPGTIGEIGFDIGIDQERRLWLLEVQAKPSWQVFYHPALATKTQDYFTSLFEFSLASISSFE